VAEGTVYRWRQKYRGMDKVHLRRLKELEQENTRLKKIVAQQVLDIDALKDQKIVAQQVLDIDALKDLLGKEW